MPNIIVKKAHLLVDQVALLPPSHHPRERDLVPLGPLKFAYRRPTLLPRQSPIDTVMSTAAPPSFSSPRPRISFSRRSRGSCLRFGLTAFIRQQTKILQSSLVELEDSLSESSLVRSVVVAAQAPPTDSRWFGSLGRRGEHERPVPRFFPLEFRLLLNLQARACLSFDGGCSKKAAAILGKATN